MRVGEVYYLSSGAREWLVAGGHSADGLTLSLPGTVHG